MANGTSTDAMAPGARRSASARAAEAMEDAARLGESLTGLPAGESRISHKDLTTSTSCTGSTRFASVSPSTRPAGKAASDGRSANLGE